MKKFNLISLFVVLVVAVLMWYRGASLKDWGVARFETFQEERAIREMIQCINKTDSITDIGYKKDKESLVVFILYLPSVGTSTDAERIIWSEAHQKFLKCALEVQYWKTLAVYYVKPQAITLLDKHQGYVPIVLLQVLVKREAAERLALVDNFYVEIDKEAEKGGVSVEDLSAFKFSLDITMMNGSPELASQRFDKYNQASK